MGLLSESTERTLRIISMWAVFPGFPLLLAAGIKTIRYSRYWYYSSTPGGAVPCLLSTIPFLITLVSGICFLRLRSKTPSLAFLVTDGFLALFYLGLLLPIWIVEPHRLKDATDFLMLETYGSTLLILNMALHFVLFVSGFSFTWRRCEHCGTRLFHRTPVQLPATTPVCERGGARYSLLGERQSYDAGEDETAALIPSDHGDEVRPSEGKAADHQV